METRSLAEDTGVRQYGTVTVLGGPVRGAKELMDVRPAEIRASEFRFSEVRVEEDSVAEVRRL